MTPPLPSARSSDPSVLNPPPRRPRISHARPAKPLLLNTHEVQSARIPPALDGVRVGHLSDIHVRTGVAPRRLERAVEMLNALAPDVVVLTGDYVCLSPKPLGALTEALRALKRPCFATLGNHDHWCGAGLVQRALERAGVDVLRNEHRVLRVGRGKVHLVGVDDSVTHHDDPKAAFANVPADASTVVLSHDPNSADGLLPFRPALILSGHTHGGQVFVKRLTPFMAKKVGIKYLHGFFQLDGALLYVNRGLGAGIPLRIGAPVEVAELILRSAGQEAGGSSP